MEIWTGDNGALLTHWQTLKDRATQLLIKYKEYKYKEISCKEYKEYKEYKYKEIS